MAVPLIAGALAGSALGTLVFSTLTYSLRDLSRVRLDEHLERKGIGSWLDKTMEHQPDLVFVTAVWRLLFNVAILLLSLDLVESFGYNAAVSYTVAVVLGTLVTLVCSIMLPQAVTRHMGDAVVAQFVRPLHGLFWLMWPIAKLMHVIDRMIGRAAGIPTEPAAGKAEHDIEQEILSVVEEGQKEGIVDDDVRRMIESVMAFQETTAGQIMTPRPEVVAIESTSTLAEIKEVLEETGHSRIPVYEGTLDHIIGVLYARDLLKQLGKPTETFSMKLAMRPAYFVPETKLVRELLSDFRRQKVHLAIVRDEYDGTAGLVSIEDVLEELVGDISDEHEPAEPAMYRQIDEQTIEADARIYLDEINRQTGLELPEDAGYDTLGGFVVTTVGRIPEAGTTFIYGGAKFTVLNAEPQRVNRVKIELGQTAGEAPAGEREPVAERAAV
ncbi:hemolysin family protein [Humisphaera borealis]|uniref:HlyC/CorC family transporter n=1 Tax=Humisphaera borealis TaxID=2807512 RepID=A0A7M2WTM4_9BACT|nr:hemolysin family protein [Humisphaera borealis]QOV88877.1 HlyC/CorC family transporter [Humisphaera borealis]